MVLHVSRTSKKAHSFTSCEAHNTSSSALDHLCILLLITIMRCMQHLYASPDKVGLEDLPLVGTGPLPLALHFSAM